MSRRSWRTFGRTITETDVVGYAGLSASLLLERRPEVGERYDSDGFANWKTQFQRWLLDLSAAIDAGEPKLFESRMLWTRKAFIARQASVSDLQAALEALRDVLRERLPEGSTGTVIPEPSKPGPSTRKSRPADPPCPTSRRSWKGSRARRRNSCWRPSTEERPSRKPTSMC